MIVLDTSIWIEFLKQNSRFVGPVLNLIENGKIVAVECIFGELLQGAKNSRERDIIIQYWENLPKCASENIWIEAGKYSSENKLYSKGIGLIDCAIVLSARKKNAQVWSLDKKLNSLLKNEEIFM